MSEQEKFERRESDKELREIKKSIACLHRSFEEFADNYKPTLDRIVQENQYWAKVRQELVTHTAKGVVWATIVGFGYIVILAAQDYARELAEAMTQRRDK